MDTTAAACPSTHGDLLFFCVLLLVPITAVGCYFTWRHSVLRDVQKHYQQQGAPVSARVVQKDSNTVDEYREAHYKDITEATSMYDTGVRKGTFPICPYYLKVRYTPLGKNNKTQTTKRLEVSEHLWENTNVGDTVRMRQIEGCDRSAIFPKEFEARSDFFTIVFCGILWLVVIGMCGFNACVSYGWTIIMVFFGATAAFVWIFLDHVSGQREQLCRPILHPNDDETEPLQASNVV